MIFEIDPLHSLVEFSVRHLMISIVKGRFSEFRGTIDLNVQNPERSSIKAVIKTDSIHTGALRRDAHLRSADFFDSSRYPTFTFESTQVQLIDQNHCILKGNFTLRGITKEIALQVTYTGQSRDPLTNAWRIGLSAVTTINRLDFGMQYNKITDGIALVGDEARIEIFAEAIQAM
ncbi:YceI family protein [Tengunoibacter tsumagoiensis]|uniref:Polyisoprenoid-binding protein n=1 Tax=Tengunoibacter tsumagoiensis TaxID=2014871 RepID=A0A401ZUD8_9CHLR|nr:YceI family protein [Tengunoibacter tsumagoiensis]GCE10447.1 polyisoprenoid-binding protein [Tengunoibacter tsumagoiensis]